MKVYQSITAKRTSVVLIIQTPRDEFIEVARFDAATKAEAHEAALAFGFSPMGKAQIVALTALHRTCPYAYIPRIIPA